ncbi:hypothetical protein GA0070620_0218 [Micromonospora krabiensis]|uniref:Uncharacterized protein n=1 Tax=Micromonospora krabiensis TaxID=307121 RepID=A0A1C3MWS5_9ACTN|nr:hypothetical protein GA0070620_0218 [Micromonospora krabiensis]
MVFAEPQGDYSWLFDLVAADPIVRHQALARHQALLAAASDALHLSNGLWAAHYRSRSSQTRLAAALDRARADFRWREDQTIYGPVHAFRDAPDDDRVGHARWAPIAALYLRWETEYPDDWGAPGSWMWSRWGTKEGLLRQFNRRGLPEAVKPQIAELILAALSRPYRCKDWLYAGLVRHLHDSPFLPEVEMLTLADDPLVQLRAQFVLQVAVHPEQTPTRTSWRRWLAARA